MREEKSVVPSLDDKLMLGHRDTYVRIAFSNRDRLIPNHKKVIQSPPRFLKLVNSQLVDSQLKKVVPIPQVCRSRHLLIDRS